MLELEMKKQKCSKSNTRETTIQIALGAVLHLSHDGRQGS